MVPICPEIADAWRGGASETARVLGVDRKTLRRYADMGRRAGGIDWKPGKRGRVFYGKEIKRFWRAWA